MTCFVKWGSKKSRHFEIPLGIKQGGINSPGFFTCYADPLIKLLRKYGIGCQMYKLFLAIILFADDICLLAPTRSALQFLIDKSSEFCRMKGLVFNPSKSKVMVFSKGRINYDDLKRISLDGCEIEYASSVKYLGVTIESDKGVSFSAKNELRNFYRAANSVLSVIKKPSEEVLMHLLNTNCIPIISYASEIKTFSAREMGECNTAINNAIRRIFTFHRWESIRLLRESLGISSIYDIFAKAQKRFHLSLTQHHNSILRIISFNIDAEMIAQS